MDNKTVFVRTSKGEAEARGQTSLLFGDAKRAFILINNKSTVDELRKHTAPSLRPVFDEMLEQLVRDDFIRDKNDTGQKKPQSGAGGNMPKISVPKMAVPAWTKDADKLAEEGEAELDFTTIMQAPSQDEMAAEAARAKGDAEAKARAEMEAKMRAEADARAEQEARMRAEAEAKARAETEARMRAEAEAKARAATEARMRAEAEAKARAETEARMRAEAEAKARAATEARIRAEAEAKARAETEARIRAEAEAKARAEMEARMRAEAEAKSKAEAETNTGAAAEIDFSSILQIPGWDVEVDKARMGVDAKARVEAEAKAKTEIRAEVEAAMRAEASDAKVRSGKNHTARSMIATVLFFDVVGYTKLSVAKQIDIKGQFNALISGFIGHVNEDQRIILDTGDGAAIGFLQHPEDALELAMKFRAAVTANNHRDYPELKVRAGIHLGPVNVMRDMNGQLNMVGDGINDAQRIMSFAGIDQIFVSRAYFDVVSRLTSESAGLFRYGGVQKDKHGREHQVYQVIGGEAAAALPAERFAGGLASIKFDLAALGDSGAASPAPAIDLSQFQMNTAAGEAPAAGAATDIPQSVQGKSPAEIEAETKRAAKLKAEQAAEAARARAQQEAAAARAKAEQDATRVKQEEAARKLAAEQAKAFAEAEKRARERAEAEAKAQAAAEAKQAKKQSSAPAIKASSRHRSKPLPWGMIGVGLLALLLAAVVALPYIWPMQDYVAQVEKELSAQLKQPVHIGSMSAASLPAPRLELHSVTVGGGKELEIGLATLYFDVLTLPADTRTINKAELENVVISAPAFGKVLPWLQAMGTNSHYPVARIMLHGAHVSDDMPLPVLSGDMNFDAHGRLIRAALSNDNGKVGMVLQPQDGHMHLDVSFKDSALPLLPNILFSRLDASGEVGDGAIKFGSIEGSLYGGTLKGSAYLAWQGGWQLQSNVNVSSLLVDKALPTLKVAGEMEGDASLVLHSEKLLQLTNVPHLEGTLRVKNGTINNLDIVETVRANKKQPMRGVTHFEELNGTLLVDGSGQHMRQIKIAAGAMSMSGSADAASDGKLSGHLLVDLNKVRAGMGTLPLVLGGTVAEPEWRSSGH